MLIRKRVAVKILHRELTQVAEVVARFEREAMAAANIDHPNVAAATDFGKLPDGSVFLVLEYVQGQSLRDVVNEGPLPIERAMHIARQITSALVRAHALGIVHRDLKPDNVMLVDKGDDIDFVKVLDFGVAKVPVQEVSDRGSVRPAKVITRVGMIFGTPEYMAPEQALGQNVDARADLYALGIIIFEMLCGRRPFNADSPVGLLGQQLQGPLPTFSKRAPNVRVPAAFEQLVQRLLAPSASSRFQSAEELALAIDALVAQRVLSSRQGSRLSLDLQSGARPLLATYGTSPGGKPAFIADEVLNASTLPAPEYDVKATKLSHDTQAKSRGASTRVRDLPARRILIWVVGGTLTSVLVVAALWLLRPAKAPASAASVSATTLQPKLPPTKPPAEPSVSDAQLSAAKGEGIAALEKLTGSFPKDVRVWVELARAQFAAGKLVVSVDTAAAAYASNPKVNEDARLATVLWKAAQRRESSERTLNLLCSGFGSRGADILYDLTNTQGVRKDVKTAAEAALVSPAAQNAASAALKALLALEHAQTCESKLASLPKIESDADARALPLLKSMRSTVGCGKGKRGDCYECMRTGLQLENAIAAVRKRDSAR